MGLLRYEMADITKNPIRVFKYEAQTALVKEPVRTCQ